jgi:phospholipase/carboxylesterase
MATTETVEIETGADPAGSVIWLHGLGADGHDFEPIVPELRLPDDLALRFVFPHAPIRPVTINGGMSMRAWYDILSPNHDGPTDEAGIRASAAILEGLIAREVERGIDARCIVVAGFSQGGAIALHTVLRHPERLAGLMALSTWLPLWNEFDAEVVDNAAAGNGEVPIFMAHGSFDPLLPLQLGQTSAQRLTDSGFDVEWHEYPMAHAVCAEEIEDIRNWLVGIYNDVE